MQFANDFNADLGAIKTKGNKGMITLQEGNQINLNVDHIIRDRLSEDFKYSHTLEASTIHG